MAAATSTTSPNDDEAVPTEKHGWPTVLAAIAVGALVVAFVVANRSDLPALGRALGHARPGWLLVGLATVAAQALNQAALHATAQRVAGRSVTTRALVAPAAGAFTVNLVTKSSGMAGLSVFLRSADREDRAPVIAGYLLVRVVSELAFAAVLAAGLVTVAVGGHLTGAEVGATVVFVLYLGVHLVVFGSALRSRAAVRAVFRVPAHLLDRLRRRPPRDVDPTSADELFESLTLLKQQPRRCVPVLGHAVAVELIGVVQVAAAVGAVGIRPSVSVALVAYTVSALFGIIGFLPGGIGFLDVSLGAVLVSYGLVLADASAAVVLYRAVELWLPLLIGALALRFAIRRPA